MSSLTAKERKSLPSKDFSGPHRSYPIDTINRARNALARASQHASPELQAKIKARVRKKFPSIKIEGEDAKPRADRPKRK